MLEHEVHFLGVDLLGCDDEVALVFAVLVIHYDNEFAFFDVFDGLFYGIEL